MLKKCCKKPSLPKNEFWFTIIGFIGLKLGLSASGISNISTYITSYIHEKQTFITMYYGLFIGLIYSFGNGIGTLIGGFLEFKLGLLLTTLTGFCLVLLSNIFFVNLQNIWFCYVITFTTSLGQGIASSLVAKNLFLYKPDKKALLQSVFLCITTAFNSFFSFLSEKIINPDGYTLKKEERFYPYEVSKNTYLHFLIGFIAAPVGAFIFALFSIEYKKNTKDLNKDEDIDKIEGIGILNEEEEEKEEENDIGKGEELNLLNNNNIDNNNNNNIDNNDINNNINNNEKNEEANPSDNKSESKIIKKHIKIALKTIRFWRLCFFGLLLLFSVSFLSNTSRTFGADVGINGKVLQALIIINTIISIIVGIIVGFFVQKKSALFFLRIGTFVMSIPGIILGFFPTSTPFFSLASISSTLGAIPISVCVGPHIMDIYGIQESVILAGILGIFIILSEIASTAVAFVISEQDNTKEELVNKFQIVFFICAGLAFISFIILFFEKKEKIDYDERIKRIKREKDEKEKLSDDDN